MLSEAEKKEIEAEIAKYPNKRAACVEALQIVQKERGWISDDSLKEVADFLEMTPDELDGVATFYTMIFRHPVGKHVILVCDSVSCWLMGYAQIRQRLTEKLGIDLGETTPDGQFTLLPNACLGDCDHAPALMVDRDLYHDLDDEKLDQILDRMKAERMAETPLTRNIHPGQPAPDLQKFEKAGGYQALRKALLKMSPAEVTDEVKKSNLRGRGGAGFPTGMKWSFVPMGEDAPHPKYLVVNGDEMEPGTFKDRLLLEGDPHQLIEGAILSAYAIGAQVGYIFLRWAYHPSAEALKRALAEAYQAGYLGKNILGTGYNLDITLHISSGRYMSGEETGLLNNLEGKRAIPRNKPPYPQVSGLWGKPTIVNNVETLCCVPHIVQNGADWFKKLSLTEDGGTKIYGASGKVNRPGLWELPMGTSLGELINEHAGGMRPGHKFRGVLPGGASTDFLVEEHMEVKMDYTHVESAGSRLGTGTMIVLDDRSCPVGMLHNLEMFFARESCGWCTPCREGLPWTARVLQALEEGQGRPQDLEILEFHTRMLGPGRTFCALAPGAMEPLQSALKYFRPDFEQHIRDARCPWR